MVPGNYAWEGGSRAQNGKTMKVLMKNKYWRAGEYFLEREIVSTQW